MRSQAVCPVMGRPRGYARPRTAVVKRVRRANVIPTTPRLRTPQEVKPSSNALRLAALKNAYRIIHPRILLLLGQNYEAEASHLRNCTRSAKLQHQLQHAVTLFAQRIIGS